MNKFDKKYYREHNFCINSNGYSIKNLLHNLYDDEFIEYAREKFFIEYPKAKTNHLEALETELAKVNAYKAALEEGIQRFNQFYL